MLKDVLVDAANPCSTMTPAHAVKHGHVDVFVEAHVCLIRGERLDVSREDVVAVVSWV